MKMGFNDIAQVDELAENDEFINSAMNDLRYLGLEEDDIATFILSNKYKEIEIKKYIYYRADDDLFESFSSKEEFERNIAMYITDNGTPAGFFYKIGDNPPILVEAINIIYTPRVGEERIEGAEHGIYSETDGRKAEYNEALDAATLEYMINDLLGEGCKDMFVINCGKICDITLELGEYNYEENY